MIQLAVARTKVGAGKYLGGGGSISIHNPKVVGQQFSATRIRLQAGSESIEAGWRVDPALYGDSLTHLFIRTDVGQSHCFNTQCPGFVHTNPDYPLNAYFSEISKPGGPIYEYRFYIIRDNKNENWNFVFGKDSEVVGYWPSNMFNMDFVDRIEFGGVVYSPLGTPLPPMGSSNLPTGSFGFDAYISKMKVLNENGETIDNFDLELYSDNPKFYYVLDAGKSLLGRMILYGGPGHSSLI